MKTACMALAACLLALVAARPGAAADALTLAEAFRIGLENNHGIRIAREEALRADGERGLGAAGFLPGLSASGSWRQVDGDDGGSAPTSYGGTGTAQWSAGVSLDWTLFDGFAMFVENDRYAELAELGGARARAAIEAELLGIARAYFGLVGQALLRDVSKETLAISATRLEQERVRRELGGLSVAAFLRAQVDYNADRAALLDGELAVTTARQSLNLLLGRDPESAIATGGEIPLEPLPAGREELIARAERENSGLAVARHGQSVAGLGARGARATFWPRLSLTAGYDRGSRELSLDGGGAPILDAEARDLSVGLRVSLDLFDGNRKRVRLRSANASARIATLERERAELALRSDLLALFDTWEQRRELVALEEENTEAARTSLALNEESYRAGASTSLEFRDAQLALARARSALIVARYEARLARLEIERLTGMLPVTSDDG